MSKSSDWDREKKVRKVVKGTDKTGKHRKSIYNMLSEYDEDDLEIDYDSESGEVKRNYAGNFNYNKQR